MEVLRLGMGLCGVVGSTLAFGSIGRGLDPEHSYFSRNSVSVQQAEITGEVPTVHDSVRAFCIVPSVSYPPGKANRVAAYP